MKLDNRPKRLLIKGASGDNLQPVRDWYEPTGQIDSVTTLDSGDILVSFKTRSAAEQGLAKGQNIPQVGQVQISWYTGQPPAPTKDNAMTSTVVPSKEDKGVEESMHSSNGIERHPSPHPQEEEVVASGWGGDGDEDGMGML
jgi:RNA-binding protein 26